MPDAAPMHFKLIFEVPTGKILKFICAEEENVKNLGATFKW